MNSLKIFYDQEVRRIPFPSPKPTWEQFQFILRSLFANTYHPEVRISYQDEEGDQITMSSELEWSAAYDFLSTQSLSKVTLTSPQNPFSQGPPPQPLYFYHQQQHQQGAFHPIPVNSTTDANLKKLSQNLPACLEKLFPEGKILPHNLPEWFRPAVNVRRCDSSNEVDVDINLDLLFSVLHTKALSELGLNQTDSARKLLEAQHCLEPTNPVTLYNLACCEALSGRKTLSLAYLEKAIKNGYNRFEHMISDSDLDSIRGEPEYLALAQELHLSQLNAKVTNLKI